ncbi:7-deoxyloganetin glucosyltransferase-like isoform X2 [Solanum tuberosum]|nr:PREDICTED: 7-deoxyloganetin glucosyltransferase-like isoform X2 [Solanum tuberosum]
MSSQIVGKFSQNNQDISQEFQLPSAYESAMEALSTLITQKKRNGTSAISGPNQKLDRMLRYIKDFQFETIPEGLPPSDRNSTQDPVSLCHSLRKNCLTPFRNLLSKFISSPAVPPISCVISDGVMSFAIKAAQEFGILDVQFWTASACGFMGYLQFDELRRRGIIPFKDDSFMEDGTLDTIIDGIPGMRNIRLKDLQSCIRTTDPHDILLNYLSDEAQNCLKSSAIIINTFTELEREVYLQMPTQLIMMDLSCMLEKVSHRL